MTESREEWADASPPQWTAQQPIEHRDDQPETPAEVEEIAAEIETTRERMSSTVEAIGQRLDPANIAQGAKDVVREATVGKVEQKMQQVAGGVENAATTANQFLDEAGATAQEATTNIVEMLRRNPVPAALIGIGIGMLWMNRDTAKSNGWSSRGGNGNGYGYAGRSAYASRSGYGAGYGSARFDRETNPYSGTSMHFESRGAHEGGSYGLGSDGGYGGGSGGGIGERVSDAVSGPASQAMDAARDVADRAGEVAAEIPQRVQYAARDVADTVAVVPDQFTVMARQAVDRASIMVEENPLGVAVAALAVGAAVGLALPATRTEQRLLGPASETVIQRAGEALTAPMEQMEQQATDRQQGSDAQQGSFGQGSFGQQEQGSPSQWSPAQGYQGQQ